MDSDNYKYDSQEVDKVKAIDIRRLIPGCNTAKGSQTMVCPACGKKRFSVVHNTRKNFAYCHECEFTLSDPIAAVAYYSNIDPKTEFLRALEETARQGGVVLVPRERRREEKIAVVRKENKSSFCQQQLEGSGLTEADVFATTIEGTVRTELCPFQKGRLIDGRIDPSGDDMLIYYYDLHGRLMTYSKQGTAKPQPYVRTRRANPDLFSDGNRKGAKYMTPKGAPCRAYIPEKMRRIFQAKAHIDTLFLNEGEKKAEKACKHGIPSIGLQGIGNFGSLESGLLTDIQDIAKACTINNIVLIMDSDWNDLHREIKVGDEADKRPKNFANAVMRFRQYMKTLANIGLSVNIWWGHINENEHGDKGIDDLLCGSLKGKEGELKEDIERTMNTHDGKGKWVSIHKITEVSDTQIRKFWKLGDAQEFYDIHKDRLKDIESFSIGTIRYKTENGKLVPLDPYESAEGIYKLVKVEKGDNVDWKVEFKDVEAYCFLTAKGFYKMRSGEGEDSDFFYIRKDCGIVDKVSATYIRDFIREHIWQICKSEIVLQFFRRKLTTLMADKQLENLTTLEEDFNNFRPGVQRTYYNNGQVEITAKGITPNMPIDLVWRNRIVARKFVRVPVIQNITKEGDSYTITLTPEAEKCEFLQFLINTSNNYFPWNAPRELDARESADWTQHIVNKITALGYLMCDYKYATECKAVVIQDHLMTEVGQSHGGAGKSIIGNAIGEIVQQFYIDGKSITKDDKFLLSGINRTTRNIFIDDVKTNFDFEMLFPMITGDMSVNPKGTDKYIIKKKDSPKILLTTNHAINKASNNASRRRIIYMEFSTWYNPDHTPVDDFNHQLFDDWDEEQWNLFDNLMAECVMFYLRSHEEVWTQKGMGAVPPPMRNIELRTLRQEMSEVFFQWAEEYYDPTGSNLNQRISRNDVLWPAFSEFAGTSSGHGVTRSNFKDKVKAYCKFKGYDFNPNKPNDDKKFCADWKKENPGKSFIGGDEKFGGKEYFTVFSEEKEKELNPLY